MRSVSIADFIAIVYGNDSAPPRPLCAASAPNATQGWPLIPGTYKAGKPRKTDLDTYEAEITRRMGGTYAAPPPPEEATTVNDVTDEDDFISAVARQLKWLNEL
ncbi:hypothetical protein [Marinobacter sp. JSM 1782161]|uniref:hypothetical protein n=1 Tax=Marinobacter sp. JSM 1782161 TaxID=2685906 RepID=UPI001401D6A3|nr:hypothetical protein [Marinobacter sp. JSM 1782161]